MSDEFVKLNDIIKLNLLYQIQSIKGESTIKIVDVGKHDKVILVPILNFKHLEYNCELLSYTITKDDIEKSQIYVMIGFMIKYEKWIIATLNYVYDISDKKFKIFFICKSKNINKCIETMETYVGREESIYQLTFILLNKIFLHYL